MIRIGVAAHTSRMSQAEALTNKVDAEFLSFDDGILGCTKNEIKVWTNLAQQGGDWLVVLEDDAVPVDDFREQLEAALAAAPTDIVSLYLGTGYPKAWQRFIKTAITAAKKNDANYALSSHLLTTVGVAMRPWMARHMLDRLPWLPEYEHEKWPIDEQITKWARQCGHVVGYTLPSLVDHAPGPSLIADHGDGEGRDEAKRVAWQVGSRDQWDGLLTVKMP
jgi:GR25 family glycosyltransferase involved in LPS biosynthesis